MLINPAWEEEEYQERLAAEAESTGAADEIIRQIDKDDMQPLNMHVPAWWDAWQAFLSELQQTGRAESGSTFTVDDVQIVYERAWADAIDRVESSIVATMREMRDAEHEAATGRGRRVAGSRGQEPDEADGRPDHGHP